MKLVSQTELFDSQLHSAFWVALSNRRFKRSLNNWGVQRVLPKKDSFASPSLVKDGGVP